MAILIYEVVSTLIFIAALVWVIRTRNPFYLGALLGGFLLFIFDWLWVGKDFFNATFNQELTMIPGLDVLGQRYPWAVAFNWAVGFGVVPLLLARNFERWSAALRVWHFPVILAVAAVGDLFLEEFLVSILQVYTYHQASEFLVWGVPWSSLWFGGGLMTLPYFAFHYVQKWVPMDARAGFSLTSENTWKAFFMAAAAMWVCFFLLTVPQTFWYSAAQPWVESGRLF